MPAPVTCAPSTSTPINEPKAKDGRKPVAGDKEREIGQGGHDLVVEEAQPKLRKPPLYQVVLLNDDYTPMEFVVDVLERIFSLDRTRATRVMLEVHTKGKGVCGVYHIRDRGDQGGPGDDLCAAAPASAAVHDGGDLIAVE